jgi:hypothetical protein
MQFWSVSVVPRHLNFPTASKDFVALFCYAFVLSSDNVTLTYI